jgi:hypothetical protein
MDITQLNLPVLGGNWLALLYNVRFFLPGSAPKKHVGEALWAGAIPSLHPT